MKRLIFTSGILLASAIFGLAQAQNNDQYQDDIYGGGNTSESQYRSRDNNYHRDEKATRYEQQEPADDVQQYGNEYSNNNQNWSNTREYQDQYSDYNDYNYDDDYYYATRLNRFYYPFYNRPFWSSFYDPYWYNPYWSDPYWGWNPWYSGMSISFGIGPCWSSYWGWNSWYGSPYFNSYYSYPYGGMGGYYSGYWNGYYAGLYSYNGDQYFPQKTITYGPRYSLRPTALNSMSGSTPGISTFRTATSSRPVMTGTEAPRNNAFGRPSSATMENREDFSRSDANDMSLRRDDRPVRNGWSESPAVRQDDARPAQPAVGRDSWFEPNRQQSPDRTQRSNEMQMPVSPEPRRFSAPEPRNEQQAPARNFERNENFRREGGSMERGGGSFNRGGGFGGGHTGGGRGGFGGGGHRR